MMKIQQSSVDYLKLMGERQTQALNFLDINEENYKLSYEQVMHDALYKQRLTEEDDAIKIKIEAKDVTETKQEIKAIWLEKLKMEGML